MRFYQVKVVRSELLSFFFFSSRRRHTRWPRDWSSDVCSSDYFKVNLRNYSILTIGTIVIMYLFKDILVFLQSIGVYDNYTVYAYGMWGQPITKSVLPIAFFIFCLFHVKKLNRESSIHRIWFNAVDRKIV